LYSIFIFTKDGGYRLRVKELSNKDFPDENYVIMRYNDAEKEERYQLIWEMYGNVQAQFMAHVHLMAKGLKAKVMTNRR
jgi:hypothetical protein